MHALLITALNTALVTGAPTRADDARALDEAAAQLDALERTAQETIKERDRQCRVAFGHPGFCSCLKSWLPWQVDFQAYVAASIASTEDIETKIEAEDVKRTLHRARLIRDYCVALLDGTLTQKEYDEDLRGAQVDVAEGRKLDRVEIRLKLLRRKHP